jgi:hypothetical protein
MFTYLKNFVEYEAMMFCANCFEIYGPWHYKETSLANPKDEIFFQTCACPSQKGEAKCPTGFDFNKIAELCYCCGQEVLKSGSKWSVWFCDECKERVVQFNIQYQWTIIPIGRHTIMAGYSLDQSDFNNPEMIKAFTENMNSLFRRINCLTEWKKLILAENFKSLGYTKDIPLRDYLVESKKLTEKSTFFLLLRDFFEQKLRGRQPS